LSENYIIASSKKWNDSIIHKLDSKFRAKFIHISEPNELTLEFIDSINPKQIFFPHWSSLISDTIYKKYECIIFHMTDLPFGRGGSPLQNLIINKIYETKISALKCTNEIDAGPIFVKYPLSLFGTAEEIYIRSSDIIFNMIVEIIENNITPVLQTGAVTSFKRRTPEQSNINNLTSIQDVFDCIRMLDAEGYPKAFIEIGCLKFEFSRASLKTDGILADVKITKKPTNDQGFQ
jgi:methionyl-tRNA formyltransferase